MRGAALAIFILGLCGFCAAQKIRFSPASKAEILQRTKNTPPTNQQRARQLQSWFRQAGCGAYLSEQQVSGSDAPNIICRLPGSSNEAIIIGAHYDRANSAGRPMENWASALLLPSLYECLRARHRHHTIIFVAFADNGNDVAGAQTYADSLTGAELSRVDAMINLDALGLSPTKIWSAHSDKELVKDLVNMVYILKLPASQVDIAAAGKTDSEPFLSRNIPQITIHSITQANLVDGMATPFRPGNYYDSYRLICGYVAYLDETRKPRPHS